MSDDTVPAHSSLGPSAAARWTVCPGSVAATANLPDEPSRPAAEGTAAHAISDLCLSTGMDAADFVGMTTRILDWTFTWTEEDAEMLQRGLDRVRELERMGGQVFGERRVSIEPWTRPGQFGTLDRAVLVQIDGVWWIFIIDLKYGRWPVYPVGNLQTVLYGLGFWNDVARHIIGDAEVRFSLSIDQPRSAGGGGVWETDLSTLLEIGEWLRGRAAATDDPDAPLVASEEGCAFCVKKLLKNGGCATYEAFNTSLFAEKFEDLDGQELILPEPGAVTPERRALILSHRKMLETWLDQLAEQELADYLEGRPTPGRKAVVDTQKGTRDAWKDEKGAEAVLVPVLGEGSFTKKLITPIQACKKISSEVIDKLEPHIKRGEKGKSMVPLADARQAIPVVLAEDFSDLPTTDNWQPETVSP